MINLPPDADLSNKRYRHCGRSLGKLQIVHHRWNW